MQPKKINSRGKPFSVATHDFFTFCINIPHDKPKSVMRELINFCFKGGEKQFIAVIKFGATCIDN